MPTGYSRVQIFLHWLMVALIAVLFLFDSPSGKALEQVRHGSTADTGVLAQMHVYGGILVLGLAVLRLLVRLVRGAPLPPEKEPELFKMIGILAHKTLYALMFLIPVAGLLVWFGGIGIFGDIHEILGNLLLFVVGLHVVGALYHQYFLHTNIMDRMRRPE